MWSSISVKESHLFKIVEFKIKTKYSLSNFKYVEVYWNGGQMTRNGSGLGSGQVFPYLDPIREFTLKTWTRPIY